MVGGSTPTDEDGHRRYELRRCVRLYRAAPTVYPVYTFIRVYINDSRAVAAEGHRILADARFGDDPLWPSILRLEDTYFTHVAGVGAVGARVVRWFSSSLLQRRRKTLLSTIYILPAGRIVCSH